MMRGGAREGAGRPRANIDEKRVLYLLSQGISQREIMRRFSLNSLSPIKRIAKAAKLLNL